MVEQRGRRPVRRDDDGDDNSGQLGVNTEGDLTIGIGSGLAVDLADGSLGLDVGGFVIDLGD